MFRLDLGGSNRLAFDPTTSSPDATTLLFGDGTGWKLHFGKRSDSGATKFLTIQDDGNVGIGRTIASRRLDVQAAGTQPTVFTGGTAGAMRLVGGSYVEGGYTNFDFTNLTSAGVIGRIGLKNTAGGSSLYFGTSNNYPAGVTNSVVIDQNANVGIGTETPAAPLNVVAQAAVTLAFLDNYGTTNPHLALRFAHGTLAAPSAVVAGDGLGSISGRGYGQTGFSTGRGRIDFIAAENWSDVAQGANVAFNTTPRGSATLTERMRIDSDGSLLIGYTVKDTDPLTKLWVNGTVKGTNIQAQYQDVAEWVPARQRLSPGTVVVVDPDRSNEVMAAAIAYDTRVAGVISARPGLALGEGGDGKVMVATTGRVRVKVDAGRGPVRVGDLLVTSDCEGFAMKSEPLELGGVPIHRPGTLIGKALEPLSSGRGEILVLLSLQ